MSAWEWVIGGILLAVGVGGVAYGIDQNNKLEQAQEHYRSEMARKREQLRDLEQRFGRQSKQFKALAKEVKRLRRLRRRAAA
jgi:uncharacterized protein HemX